MEKTKFINVIVGDIDVPRKRIIECCITETVNQSIICMKIDDILQAGHCKRTFLLLSDAASYMMACTRNAKGTLPTLVSCYSLAHMLHDCAEKVRVAFADVDNLVARIKAATIKNKSRQTQFKYIGSPPEPVVTRWGTWLKAADYYADNLIEVKKNVNEFEGHGILVKKRTKEAMNDAGKVASLLKMKRDYSQLPKIIQKIVSEIQHC